VSTRRAALRGAVIAVLAAGASGARAAQDAGARLYRDGVGVAGTPVLGTVQGDVPVTGAQVSCAGCHGRSGLGSAEGGKVAPPITGAALRAARSAGPRPRPAYDAAALARALREGVDAAGRPLDPLMPRFRLVDADVAALGAHLDRLSAVPSPGVSPAALHLATVIAPDAPPEVCAATLAVARAFVAAQRDAAAVERARHPPAARPARGGLGERGDREYVGEWILHAWTLRGPPSGWAAQLEALERAQPVFVVVSGAGGAGWSAVQRFCEARALPCLLPNVDTPPAEPAAWYASYFSRGEALEAEVVAARLAREAGPQRVLQVFRPEAAPSARALATSLRLRGRDAAVELPLSAAAPLRAEAVVARARAAGATAVMLWLDAGDLRALAGAGEQVTVPVHASATRAGGDLEALRAVGGAGFAVHPFAVAPEGARRFQAASLWLARRGVTASTAAERRAQDQTLFAFRAFAQAFQHLNGHLHRDFLLEQLDHASGVESLSAFHPRLAFGPSRRYLSMGCWLVPRREPDAPADWVVP
jgi:hypothetical protein